MQQYDLIIIGAGPAGLTAGLYAGRFQINTLIMEKISFGGQITLSSTIENYPGFPGGISTHELMDKFKAQVDELGVKTQDSEVTEIIPEKQGAGIFYRVRSTQGDYLCKALIIASGAQARRLGVDGEERLIGRGVSYCGTCDGPLFRNKEVVLIGGGDRAVEEAIFLSGYANKVIVVHRRQEFRASKILVERAKNNPRISFVLDSVVRKICGENRVESVILSNVKSHRETTVECQGVFVFVGIAPNTDFLKKVLQINEAGFIITKPDQETSLSGVFACGDCIEKSLYQVVNACGEAAVAANSAHKYLFNLG
ncbi:MAG: thioredoxin-disulfide reductase [Candidatus Omnitrophica bacterium]|nr:thioredoxin-disulfide reductase [Candidatus Omnitrophota bacterium]